VSLVKKSDSWSGCSHGQGHNWQPFIMWRARVGCQRLSAKGRNSNTLSFFFYSISLKYSHILYL
jgi:hypothetical protein